MGNGVPWGAEAKLLGVRGPAGGRKHRKIVAQSLERTSEFLLLGRL